MAPYIGLQGCFCGHNDWNALITDKVKIEIFKKGRIPPGAELKIHPESN